MAGFAANEHGEFKVFVKNLPWSANEDTLYSEFGAVGNVSFARVCSDSETGNSRGFGFVSFSDQESATAAIKKLNGKELDGRQITVLPANSKGDSRGAGSNDRSNGYNNRSNGNKGVCFKFQKGMCTFGDSCKFSHEGGDNTNAPAANSKTCFAFQKGNCKFGDSCRFEHEGKKDTRVNNKRTFGGEDEDEKDEESQPSKKITFDASEDEPETEGVAEEVDDVEETKSKKDKKQKKDKKNKKDSDIEVSTKEEKVSKKGKKDKKPEANGTAEESKKDKKRKSKEPKEEKKNSKKAKVEGDAKEKKSKKAK